MKDLGETMRDFVADEKARADEIEAEKYNEEVTRRARAMILKMADQIRFDEII